jgi:cathepsin F
MVRRALLAAAFALGSANADGTVNLAWKDCGGGTQHGTVQSLSPSSLTLGEKTTVTGTGTVDEAVASGTFAIDIKAGIITKSFSGDLCTAETFDLPLDMGSIVWDGMACPLAAGTATLSTDITLSSSIPSSLASGAVITIQATDSAGAKLVCLEVDTSSAQLASEPVEEAERIALGLVEGFIGDTDLKTCIKDSKLTIGDLKSAVKEFDKEDATDALKGLRELAEAIKEFPQALTSCNATVKDIKNIVSALKQLASPTTFAFHAGKNLLVNHHDIFKDISRAIKNYKSHMWHDFGMEVGKALNKLIVGVEARFSEFCALHKKIYTSAGEKRKRLAIFSENLEQVYYLQRAEAGTAEYSYLSPYADMSAEEFSSRNGFKYSSEDALTLPRAELLDVSDTPDSWDWVDKGAVNAVKNQEQCGSCWAFATVANIEGAGFVETGKLVSLSEQQLVDCDKKTGDVGCSGGLPSNAYKDMIAAKFGLELEKSYPYVARDTTCTASTSKEIATITAYQAISTDEDQIAAALVKYGPLAIGINAGPMQLYHGGIAKPWKLFCNPKKLDHGVAIVGFGIEKSKKYWKIRNSWGSTWGEEGYYRIIRGTGACGLNTMVTTATGIKLASEEKQFVV